MSPVKCENHYTSHACSDYGNFENRQSTLYDAPKIVELGKNQPVISHNGTRYLAKDKIPPDAWKHIDSKHKEAEGFPVRRGSSYFFSHLTRPILSRMIRETATSPREYKIDDRPREGRGSGKMIYKFQEYDRIIGRHGERETPCKWLVVVAKSNGWIKTAYPVPCPFLPSS